MTQKKLLGCLILACLAATESIWGNTTLYVSNSGADGNDGLSWVTAKATLGAAITLSSDGDVIEVSSGTYSAPVTVNKRVAIIGAGKTGGTTIGGSVTVNAPVNGSMRVALQSLEIVASSGNGIVLQTSLVTLENVSARGTAVSASGLRIAAAASVSDDIMIESCDFCNNSNAGVGLDSTASADGFVMRNCRVAGNTQYGLCVPQSSMATPEFKNVTVENCVFTGGTSTSRLVYIEKLKDAVFSNIAVLPPSGNTYTAFDLNLKYRTDYGNIVIRNSRIDRSSATSYGIYLKGREDYSPPSALRGVLIQGVTFTNCVSDIVMENDVSSVTIEKCDLRTTNHSAPGFGVANYTTSGTAEAENNYWGGTAPSISHFAVFNWASSADTLTLVRPSTANIHLDDYVLAASGIIIGTQVTEVTSSGVKLSIPTTGAGTNQGVIFVSRWPPIDIVEFTSGNSVTADSYLTGVIVNDANSGFADLAAAVTGTSPGGTIYNCPNTQLSGDLMIDKELTLVCPGEGYLGGAGQNYLKLQDLTLGSGGKLTAGSDLCVTGTLTNSSRLSLNGKTLVVGSSVAGSGDLEGNVASSLFVMGSNGGNVGAIRFAPGAESLLSLILARSGSSPSVSFASDVATRFLTLTSGVANMGDNVLSLQNDRVMGGSASSYINGSLQLATQGSSKSTLVFPVGDSTASLPVTVTGCEQAASASCIARVIDGIPPDYGNREPGLSAISKTRHWTVTPSPIPAAVTSVSFDYGTEDLGPVVDRRVTQYRNGTSQWTSLGPVPGTASPIMSTLAVSPALGKFCLASTSALPDAKCTLTYAAGPHGAVSGASVQIVDYGQSGTQVSAVSDDGYQFAKWSDDFTSNPRTDTNVTTDICVTALFSDVTPPVSAVRPVADRTRAATTLNLDFQTSDSGSGVSSTSLWARTPGAGTFTDTGTTQPGTSGGFAYSVTAGNGLYEFATRATDNEGNCETTPTAASVSIWVNTTPNGPFSQYYPSGSDTCVYPMTDDLDVSITLAGAEPGCSIVVSRSVPPATPPAYFRQPGNLLGESLNVNPTGLGSGFTAILEWQYDIANLPPAGIDKVWRFGAGQTPEAVYDVIPEGTMIRIGGVTGFSTWYAGSATAVPVRFSRMQAE